MVFEYYFSYKNKHFSSPIKYFWMAHTHTTPSTKTSSFLFLLHGLTRGRKHIQEQNEIINELYLNFFNLLGETFPASPHDVAYVA